MDPAMMQQLMAGMGGGGSQAAQPGVDMPQPDSGEQV